MKLILGDCLDKLKELDDNSVDSIVTDPPYGLSAAPNSGKSSKGGFMGKEWDYDVPSQEIWEECMRVLKPGGHLLSFAGSRTYHRMAVRIEDAGFEIRDQIMWVYGCLTEDTEILTKEGWKHYHKITKDDIYSKGEILVYDTERDIYKWERPERWYVYSLNEDTVYRIRGNQTDQLVSKDHNCIVEREGKLVFIKSQDLGDMERVPILSNDFSFLQEEQIKVLQPQMQRKISWRGMERVGEDRRGDFQSTSQQNEESKLRRKKWSVERWNNLQEQEGLLLQSKNKIREVSRRIQKYGKERWIRNGIQVESSTGIEETFVENGMCTSYRPQSRKQRDNQSNVIQEQLRPQEIRSGTSYTPDMATITKEIYSGIIFCPTTSTGAFIARRNGKVFITGNSGFPKSMNISKQIDKREGAEREVIGSRKDAFGDSELSETEDGRNLWGKSSTQEVPLYSNKAATDEAKKWNGWGTALKPAHEPIVMARKPLSEKTVVDNVLEWGTGGINIDDSRIRYDENNKPIPQLAQGKTKVNSSKTMFDGQSLNKSKTEAVIGGSLKGRFPANIIFDEEAGKILDEQSRTSKSNADNNRDKNKDVGGFDMSDNKYKSVGNSEWEGWGTALKPAHEPIVMARKPLSEKTVVDNVLEWGTGGINIDDSRIGTEQRTYKGMSSKKPEGAGTFRDDNWIPKDIENTVDGRFPANIIFDEEAGKILDEQSGTSKSTGGTNDIVVESKFGQVSNRPQKPFSFGDKGGASRFFYCPKTSKRDRNEGLDEFDDKYYAAGNQAKAELKRGNVDFNANKGKGRDERHNHNQIGVSKNNHPTVKPLDLCLYLIRLVTPKGGTTLDPFMGSGSTGKAAVRGGFDFIGIEREEEYMKIAKARIQYEIDNPYNEETGKRVTVNKQSQKFW